MSWEEEKELFYNIIIENDIIGFFKEPLHLKSGRLSYWYVNWRNISEDIFLLDKLTDYIISFVESLGLKPDCFYGVPEGATKLGIITQYKWAKKQPNYTKGAYILSMGRAKPKQHGDPKDKYYLGFPKGKIIVLEDTLTTGGSLIETIEKLHSFNVKIIAAIGLTDRNEIRESKEILITGHVVKEAENISLSIPEINDTTEENITQEIVDWYKKFGERLKLRRIEESKEDRLFV